MTRKDFLKRLWGLVALPYVLLLLVMTARHRRVRTSGVLNIPGRIEEGISFHGKVICTRFDNKLLVYSSRCTHLGCRIDALEDGLMVCPCHGSKFNSEGRVVEGPAMENLKPLSYIPDTETGGIVVNLES